MIARYEYAAERVTVGASELLGILNRWADEGWRFHSMVPWGGGVLLIFERVRPSKKARRGGKR